MRVVAYITLAVLCAFGLGALAGVGTGWRPFGATSGQTVTATISGNQMHIDPAYLRFADQRGGGEMDHIDLVARFPDFLPLGATPQPRDSEDPKQIVVTISAPDDAVDPAERPSKLYGRFLSPEAWSHPGGLVIRHFEPGSPYENEDLYLAPPEGRSFSARCMRAPDRPDGLPDNCIAELRQSGLDVRLRFSPELLPEWTVRTDGARGLVRSLLVRR